MGRNKKDDNMKEIKEKPEEMRESPAGRSVMSLYQECPRKWYFRYVLGWRAKALADPLALGSAVHEAQEVFYNTNFNYDKCIDRGLEVIKDLNPLLTDKLASALHIWHGFIGRFEREKVKVLLVEEPIDIKLPNGFVMTGRLDRLLQDLETDEIFIDDTKTTGWDLTKTFRNYTYHDQPKLYFAGFKDTFPELATKCNGWRTDGIYVRERLSKGVGTGEFYGHAERSPIVTFLDGQLGDIRNSYASFIDDMAYKLALVEKEGESPSLAFPGCGSHCLAYNKICEYYNYCHKVDESPSMPHNFTRDEWVDDGTVLNQFRSLPQYTEV